MSRLQMIVNGTPVDIEVDESRYLSDVLRDDLRLTGTKIGCAEAECGICTVLVEGTPVVSCVYPAFKAQGRHVETIEGLEQDGRLHALQQAFLDHGAVQCGICTPGLIMTAKGLLDRKAAANEAVTEADIRAALKDSYCRCTGYQSVINAILQASGQDVPPYLPETRAPETEVGKPRPNPNALAKIRGTARFTDDYHFPGMLFARTKRAHLPHARIVAIDVAAARELDGVRAVLTHEDVPGRNAHGVVSIDWPVLCGRKVRYAGDAVAIVAADTEEIATAALDLIAVEYEELPAVTDPIAALQPDAPQVHEERPDGNLLKHIKVGKGDIEAGFAAADVVVDQTYRTPTTEHLFLEPECSIGVPAGYNPARFGGVCDALAKRGETAQHDKTTIYVGSQIPYADRDQAAATLGVEPDDVRVVATLMGGGFGGKEDITGQIHAALLAEATQRPVKMLYSRQESLLVHPKRHATVIRMRTGATKDGKLTAVEATLYGDGGAYASLSEKVLTRATTHASGPYDVPNVQVDCFATYTNNVPAGAFRGFGVTQSCFAAESNMDILAGKLGTRSRRVPPPECARCRLDHGHRTGHARKRRPARMHRQGRRRYARRRLPLDLGRRPQAPRLGPCDWLQEHGTRRRRTGQGHRRGRGLAGPGQGPGCRGSNLLGRNGPGLAGRPRSLRGRRTGHPGRERQRAARRHRCLSRRRPDHGQPADLRQRQCRKARRTRCRAETGRLHQEPGLSRSTNTGRRKRSRWAPVATCTSPSVSWHRPHCAKSTCAPARSRSAEIVAAHDVGRAINPLTLEGQIEGGIVMCIGYALTEHYIQEDGKPWTNVMARYKTPSITHAPSITSHIVEHELSTGPFGAKGMGELPSIPTSAGHHQRHLQRHRRARPQPACRPGHLLHAIAPAPTRSNSAGAIVNPSPQSNSEGNIETRT